MHIEKVKQLCNDENIELSQHFLYKTCFYCKGEMTNGFTNYMVDIGERFIIIKNVPCHKCSQCGEVSYSGQVAAQLEKLVEQIKSTLETEVCITEYKAAA